MEYLESQNAETIIELMIVSFLLGCLAGMLLKILLDQIADRSSERWARRFLNDYFLGEEKRVKSAMTDSINRLKKEADAKFNRDRSN